jgi:hypothetical protein
MGSGIRMGGRGFPSRISQTLPQKPNAVQICVDSTRLIELWHSRRCASSELVSTSPSTDQNHGRREMAVWAQGQQQRRGVGVAQPAFSSDAIRKGSSSPPPLGHATASTSASSSGASSTCASSTGAPSTSASAR